MIRTERDGVRVTFLRRADWGASRPPLGHAVEPRIQDHQVVHHSASWIGDDGRDHVYAVDEAAAAMRVLETARPDLGLDIPYHFVLWPGGQSHVIVAEGRGMGRTGAHAPGHNRSGVGVCFAGNYHAPAGGVSTVPDELIVGCRWIGAELMSAPEIGPTLDHAGTGRATACAGDAIRARLAELQPPFTAGDDMTPDQARQLDELHQALVGKLAAQHPAGAPHDIATSVQETRHMVASLAADLDDLASDLTARLVDVVVDSMPGDVVTIDMDALAAAVRAELGRALSS